ncbi:unnamed protein product [Arctogadus glacialis]
MAKNTDPTFSKTGFQTGKHIQSNAHKVAVTSHCHKAEPVEVQSSSAKAAQQQESRRWLVKIVGFSTAWYSLARQGAALRGRAAEEGNFCQLLEVSREDDPGLGKPGSARIPQNQE